MELWNKKRIIFGLWLGWALALLAFQVLAPARLELARPDYSVSWTATETLAGSQDGKIFLLDPFMNQHVSWDSEYYLAIAVSGYDAPTIHRVGSSSFAGDGSAPYWPYVIPNPEQVMPGIPLTFAFFPLYPIVIRLVSLPLSLLGLTAIATATLAGVLVSLLGALAGMWALYHLAESELGQEGGLRAAFYLLIFPSSFFLAQVYTEGLFIGLAFSSLWMLRRGRFFWAALLAVLATFTRAVGVALMIPLLISWLQQGEWLDLDLEWRQIYEHGLPWKVIGRGLVAVSPALAFMAWRVSYYGMAFSRVEEAFFGRGLLSLGASFINWSDAFRALYGSNSQAAAYYAIEWGAVVLGLTACIVGLRRHRDLAWFGLAVVLLSFTSGPAQGMHRYVLAAPPLFLFLSRLGRSPAFDRAWTVFSVLLMGLLALLFSFDMWTG